MLKNDNSEVESKFRITYSQSVSSAYDISAVFAVIFDKGDRILTVNNTRGWDLPGGHTEPNEEPEEALTRECAEEAYVIITNPVLFMAASNKKTMLFYLADVKVELPFLAEFEATNRTYLHPKEFFELYEGGMPLIAKKVIDEALRVRKRVKTRQ